MESGQDVVYGGDFEGIFAQKSDGKVVNLFTFSEIRWKYLKITNLTKIDGYQFTGSFYTESIDVRHSVGFSVQASLNDGYRAIVGADGYTGVMGELSLECQIAKSKEDLDKIVLDLYSKDWVNAYIPDIIIKNKNIKR